jgi:hypothetical protein
MKKIKSLMTLAILALVLPSCKKDYTCTCVVNKKTYTYSYKGETKGEASNTCSQQDAAAKRVDMSGTCSLSNGDK